MSDIDIRVSADLHPANVEKIEGYGDPDVAPFLSPTYNVFYGAYLGVRDIWNAKEAGENDPTLTPAAKLIKIDDYAHAKLSGILRGMDSTLANLNRTISSLEKELSVPIEAKAALVIATEVRAHLKGLDTNKRMEVIRAAIAGGDDRVATAALGSPAMLSGLTDEMQAALIKQYHSHRNPTQAKRLKALEAAKALIENNGALVLRDAEKAVGYLTEPKSMRRIYASDLRKARDAAEHPFKVA